MDILDMKIIPDKIIMEGETVLTQYIVPYWSLNYINQSKHILVKFILLYCSFKFFCIPESFIANISHQLFDYTMTFVNLHH